MILVEHGPSGAAALFDAPKTVLIANCLDDVSAVLQQAEQARRAGAWIAGYLTYEAGYAFEPRLRAMYKPDPDAPLVVLGVYDRPNSAANALEHAHTQAKDAALGPVTPLVSRADYDAAFERLQNYIAAGDCYQANLTFPLQIRLGAGTALGLYGALRARQQVGFGAFIDLGQGPVIISRSPEMFFTLSGRTLQSRPMKGTAPRGTTQADDAHLRHALATSEKVQAENLMIVDLLRNDIGRLSKIGSVHVPELFKIDSFATVHQMSSRIEGQLRCDPDLAHIMAALFPCGSVTGAPKIRAMQIIAELEPYPRGVYCGAIGWAAPNGDQAWSVAIRTLRLYPQGRILANVGGGVVHDSTADGEWEEALWKARYLQGLTTTACT